MKKLNKIFASLFSATVVAMSLVSCSEDEFTPTIFPDVPEEIDPATYTYQFDKWLKQSYLDPFNLEFRYKMEDVGTDINYNLVPARLDKAQKLAVLTKYLWFEVYDKVINKEFLKKYGPRIIHLIGSPAYNPSTGTMILGLAEGGIKVSLFRVNEFNEGDMDELNEFYFKTMHHEFAHILHQTKTYPREFNTISQGHYDSNNWQDRSAGECASMGFFSNYASSETREDFAETIANYIVKTDAQIAYIYLLAGRGWETDPNGDAKNAVYYCWYYYTNNQVADENKKYVDSDSKVETTTGADGTISYTLRGMKDTSGNPIVVYPVEDKDGIDGVKALDQKVNLARTWMSEAFGADLDALRAEVQYRQANFNLDSLLNVIKSIK